MNPIRPSLRSTLFEAIRRYGWFPLAVFLAHELCAHVLHAYARWPSIDIPLHFFGGLAIAYFTGGVLRVAAARGLVRAPDPILRVLLLFALACTAAVFWEFAEWLADRTIGTACQLGLDDTLLDLFMGLLGGFAYLLPQLPDAFRNFFRSSPETPS